MMCGPQFSGRTHDAWHDIVTDVSVTFPLQWEVCHMLQTLSLPDTCTMLHVHDVPPKCILEVFGDI